VAPSSVVLVFQYFAASDGTIRGVGGSESQGVAAPRADLDHASDHGPVVTLGVERWRQGRTALANVLLKNPDVVSWWVGEGVKRRLEEGEFADELDRLDRQLTTSANEARGKGGTYSTS